MLNCQWTAHWRYVSSVNHWRQQLLPVNNSLATCAWGLELRIRLGLVLSFTVSAVVLTITLNANAYAHRPMLRLELTVTSGMTCGWMARVHKVLPATFTFIHKWNEPSCMHFVSIHQMASPEQGGAHQDQLNTHLSTPKG